MFLSHPQPLHHKGTDGPHDAASCSNDASGAFFSAGGFSPPLFEGVNAVFEAGVRLLHLRECPADPFDVAVRFQNYGGEIVVHGYPSRVCLCTDGAGIQHKYYL